LTKDELEETGLKPVPKLKSKGKTKKELKNEKKDLESKLTSVEELMEFIDKKHSSGKIDDNEYSKRSKKLESDVKKTKKKMSVIDKLLEK
jgi:peptidoglycan hydrolase CwlO-like protein